MAAPTNIPRGQDDSLLEATYRSNTRYQLVQLDRMTTAERAALPDLDRDLELYGLLVPRDGTNLGVKAVGRDAALLYLTLLEPGKLPTYVRRDLGSNPGQAVAELVLDGVLEVEVDGAFVSGPAAHRQIIGETNAASGLGVLARRSIEALQYAEALDITDRHTVSARLYGYGRQPLSPQLHRMFPTRAAVADHLGVSTNRAIASTLARSWYGSAGSQQDDLWLSWRSRFTRVRPSASEPTYKLYVSPHPDAVRDAFEATIQVASGGGARAFKVGADVYGLLRPDKLVVYFDNIDDLQRASAALIERLAGCPPHGVPFTADVAGDGLLSWAVDLPADVSMPGRGQPESWRIWVTNRLGIALVSAKAVASDTVQPWMFALDRLRLDGVDTTSWIPTPALWRRGELGG